MSGVEGDFDFLKYLDFGTHNSSTSLQDDAFSDDLSYSSASSSSNYLNQPGSAVPSSTFASPQDLTFSDYTGSNYGANSPPPLFAAFDGASSSSTTNTAFPPAIQLNGGGDQGPTGMTGVLALGDRGAATSSPWDFANVTSSLQQQQQQQQHGSGSAVSSTSPLSSLPSSSSSPASNKLPGSPPFDVSFLTNSHSPVLPSAGAAPSFQHQATSAADPAAGVGGATPAHQSNAQQQQQQQQQQGPQQQQRHDGLASLGFANPDSHGLSSQSTLAQQYQQLLVQQAQIQLQMQLQQLQESHEKLQQQQRLQQFPHQQPGSGLPPSINHQGGLTSTYIQPPPARPVPALSKASSPPLTTPLNALSHLQQSHNTGMGGAPLPHSLILNAAPPPANAATSASATSSAATAATAPAAASTLADIQPVATLMKKATLKRNYQPMPKTEEVEQDMSMLSTPSTTSISHSSSSSDMKREGSAAEASASPASSTNDSMEVKPAAPAKGGHNAVEQKYRRGINDSLIMLREIVPALQHLRAAPGTAPSKRKVSQFSLAASVTPSAPSGFVDGVMAPKKLSKQLILLTATDYIRYLINRREELEGELATLRSTVQECVEDSHVVMDIFEQRWAPHRARILDERTRMQLERQQSKEKTKKRKLQDATSATDSAVTTAGNDAKRTKRAGTDSDESDEDSDEDEDEEMEADADVTTGTSSALPIKTQPRSRKGQPKKPPARSQAKPFSNATAAFGTSSPPKALMSVFAGVSFAGGAAYDLLYGASGASYTATSSGDDSVNPAQVWSHGLVRRAGNVSRLPVIVEHEASLHPLQTFFLERPALLSGLVMLSLSCIVSYTFFYLLPNFYSRFTSRTRAARKQDARLALVQMAKDPSIYTASSEQAAFVILSDAPSSVSSQMLSLPGLAIAFVTGLFTSSSRAAGNVKAADPASVERTAAALRLLEIRMRRGSWSLGLITAYLYLLALINGSDWPTTAQTASLTTTAEATLALATQRIFGTRLGFLSRRLWTSAQTRYKKHDSSRSDARLAMALSFTPEQASRISSAAEATGATPLLDLAEERCKQLLLNCWKSTFALVMDQTAPSASGGDEGNVTPTLQQKRIDGSLPSVDVDALDEILSVVPPASPLFSLALVCKGVQALGRNDRLQVLQIASTLAASSATTRDTLASAAAFVALASGSQIQQAPVKRENDIDVLAYVTIAWLGIRAAASGATTAPSSANGDKAVSGLGSDESRHTTSVDESLQTKTLDLRRLLASPVFTGRPASFEAQDGEDHEFVDAQEKCVEGLVYIGRKAAGLDSLSDSGCEL